MSNFRPVDRDTSLLLPPSVDDWLPKDHLTRFVIEIVEQLDLSALTVAGLCVRWSSWASTRDVIRLSRTSILMLS
ncbi:MAG: hypothetical protein ACHBMF_07615 [Chromatiales bacterium]